MTQDSAQTTEHRGDAGHRLRPAASVVVLREAAAGLEVLMLQRSSQMAFAPGAWVFPGGRVDAADIDLAASLSLDLATSDAAGRIAAIRETLEECGLAIGLFPLPDSQTTRRMRAELSRGATFAELLDSHGMTVDLSIMSPYARWCPGAAERSLIPRYFDARIYVTPTECTQAALEVDRSEISDFRWATPANILQSCAEGSALALFPTRRILERIALRNSIDDVVATIPDGPFRPIVPWKEVRAGIMHLCIPADRGYPVTAELFDRVRRELAGSNQG